MALIAYILVCDWCGKEINGTKEEFFIVDDDDVCSKCVHGEN